MTLPNGWHSDERDGHSIDITRPGFGGVTINWESRQMFQGYGYHGRQPILFGDKYKGRGWQERLLADAISWLEALT